MEGRTRRAKGHPLFLCIEIWLFNMTQKSKCCCSAILEVAIDCCGTYSLFHMPPGGWNPRTAPLAGNCFLSVLQRTMGSISRNAKGGTSCMRKFDSPRRASGHPAQPATKIPPPRNTPGRRSRRSGTLSQESPNFPLREEWSGQRKSHSGRRAECSCSAVSDTR